MMKFVRDFVLFWYDFIVGDDWLIAVGAMAAVIACVWLTGHGLNAWWLLPIVVAAFLAASLLREVRNQK